MAVGEVVADAVILVVLMVVNEGLDLDDENESDGELTLLPELLLLLLVFVDGICEGVDKLFCKLLAEFGAPFTGIDFL